jgi:hypothetical protein
MIRIHKISGKERGLMVIGTASELRHLATDLKAGLDGKPEKTEANFPEFVTACLPVKNLDQGISFNLETSSGDQPRSAFLDTEVGKTIFLVLAVIGVISIVRWVMSHAL